MLRIHGNNLWRTFKPQYINQAQELTVRNKIHLCQFRQISHFGHACRSWQSAKTGEFNAATVNIVIRTLLKGNEKCHTNVRSFSTSSRRSVPPFFWILAKPLAKVVSVISGRTLRKVFHRLPKAQKQEWRERIKAVMPGVFIGIIGFSAVNYYTHIEEAPITKRKRYIAFTEEQFMKIAQFEYEAQIEILKDTIVPVDNPHYNKVAKVITNLVKANQDIDFLREHTLTIIVVDQKERNAFVLPTGHIFVNTGLLDMVLNEDQLAVVMGHELSHAILHHGAERVSAAGFLDNIIIMLLGAIWFFIPSDGIALVTHWFFNKVVHLMLSLPYDRKLETEADEVGLQLMAKACYDVRESSNFWDLMKYLRENENGSEEEVVDVPELFSTHPSNETRMNTLGEMIPWVS